MLRMLLRHLTYTLLLIFLIISSRGSAQQVLPDLVVSGNNIISGATNQHDSSGYPCLTPNPLPVDYDSGEMPEPYDFNNVVISNGATLTLCAAGGLYIRAKESFTIEAGAKIDVSGKAPQAGACDSPNDPGVPAWYKNIRYGAAMAWPYPVDSASICHSGPGGDPLNIRCGEVGKPGAARLPANAGEPGGNGGFGGSVMQRGACGEAGGKGGSGEAGSSGIPGGVGGNGGAGGANAAAGSLIYIESRIFSNQGLILAKGLDAPMPGTSQGPQIGGDGGDGGSGVVSGGACPALLPPLIFIPVNGGKGHPIATGGAGIVNMVPRYCNCPPAGEPQPGGCQVPCTSTNPKTPSGCTTSSPRRYTCGYDPVGIGFGSNGQNGAGGGGSSAEVSLACCIDPQTCLSTLFDKNTGYAGGGGGKGAGGGGGGGGGGGVVFIKAARIINNGEINTKGGQNSLGAFGFGSQGSGGEGGVWGDTVGGFGGLPGGHGGRGGKGADGPIVMIYSTQVGVGNLQGTVLPPLQVTSPQLRFGQLGYDFTAAYPGFRNGWLNQKALFDIKDGQGEGAEWFRLSPDAANSINFGLGIPVANVTTMWPNYFGIESVGYQIFNTDGNALTPLRYLRAKASAALPVTSALLLNDQQTEGNNYKWYSAVSQISNLGDNFDFFATGLPEGALELRVTAQSRGHIPGYSNGISFTTMPLRYDRRAPCDQPTASCSVLINGGASEATNNTNIGLFFIATDGTGSGLDEYQMGFRFAGTPNFPPPEDLYVYFPGRFSEGGNEIEPYSPVRTFLVPDNILALNPSGWYVFCARYRDKAGNITTQNNVNYTFTAQPNTPVPFDEATGDLIWNSDTMRYGTARVCSAVNIDTVSPPAPIDLKLTQSKDGTSDAVILYGPNTNDYLFPSQADLQGQPYLGVDLGATTINWTNENIVRVRWNNPVEPLPASPISQTYYKLSSPYIPGDGPPISNMGSGNDGLAATVLTDAQGAYFDVPYDPNNPINKDGCKNIYVWLADKAGNKQNLLDQTFRFNAGLFCFDHISPSAPTNIKFYSKNALDTMVGAINYTTKEFEEQIADLRDLTDATKEARLDYNQKNIPITNKNDRLGLPDRIVVSWNAIIDHESNGHQASGIDANSGYQICWSTELGAEPDSLGTTCSTGIVEYVNVSDGNSGKILYTLSQNEMDDLQSNIYYFYVIATDRAKNSSSKSTAFQVIIDYSPPCFDSDNFGNSVGQNKCSMQISNWIENSVSTSQQVSKGSNLDDLGLSPQYKQKLTSLGSIKYLLCGDNIGNERCDNTYSETPIGGLILGFQISVFDGLKGSGFDPNQGGDGNEGWPGNVKIGIGMDLWSSTVSDEEMIFWFDERLPFGAYASPSMDTPKPLLNGSVPFNVHFVKPKSGFDFSYYQANRPTFEFYDLANSNVDYIELESNDGQELIRNIYVRLLDIAGNWSPHNHTNNRLLRDTIIVDTSPPPRITDKGQIIEVKVNANTVALIRENNGLIEYSVPSPINWVSDIQQLPIVVNNNTFTLEYLVPADLTGVIGAWYKINAPPTGYADLAAIFDGGTPGQTEIILDQNFSRTYLWLKDKSGNPDSNAVPLINDYYTYSNNNLKPCFDANTGTVNYSNAASTKCRVFNFRLPYDGTKPRFSTAQAPYVNTPNGAELIYTSRPVIHFKGAVDDVQLPYESGIRITDSYAICYDTQIGGCANKVFVSDPSGIATDLTYTPQVDLPDGNWFFSIRAYDKAGNESLSSLGKQITIDTSGPCIDPDPNNDPEIECHVTVNAGAWSTGARDVSVSLAAQDASLPVTSMVLGEYYEVGPNCYAIFLLNTGQMSSPVSQSCSGEIDFTPVISTTPVVTNSIRTFDFEVANFTFSAAEGNKTISVIFQDSAGKWSPVQKDTIFLDTTPPGAPENLTVLPANSLWSNSSTATIQMQFPMGTNADLSSNGSAPFGIKSIYFKISALQAGTQIPLSAPTNSTDGQAIEQHNWHPAVAEYTVSTVDFRVAIPGLNSGSQAVYFWLEDMVGNKSQDNAQMIIVSYDASPPSRVTDLRVIANSPMVRPNLTWAPSSDIGSQLHNSTPYKICWDLIAGSCSFSTTSSTTQGSLSNSPPLSEGIWFFHIRAIDNALNESLASDTVAHTVTSLSPVIEYVGTGNFANTAVFPTEGIEGTRSFRILYYDYGNLAPQTTKIWIDLNGDNSYSENEKLQLHKTGSSEFSDNDYANGEEYGLDLSLSYNKVNDGNVKYRFDFTSQSGTVSTGDTSLTPNVDYIARVDRYTDNFDGIAQVRNNVRRPGMAIPVVIVLKTQNDKSKLVTVRIVNRRGSLIKSLVEQKPYSEFERSYIFWDDSAIASGVYYAVITVGDESIHKPIVVVR